MKNNCIKLFLLCLASFLLVNTKAQEAKPAPLAPPGFKKGVPKPEMKQYWFVMLVKGKNRNEKMDSIAVNKLQEGHMANIKRLAEMGKLTVAGPFGDDGLWRGILIFDVPTKEEVIGFLKEDPAIAAGRLDYEIHPWWTAQGTTFK